MAKQLTVQITENFEQNLHEVERFLVDANAAHAYDALLDELLGTVIPNLERFPEMGRSFFARSPVSVETTNAQEGLWAKLQSLNADRAALREYILDDYLLLYVPIGSTLYLLAIKHHRQLSFDFNAQWGNTN